MRRPMILLTICVAIHNEHARLARLETNEAAPLLTALGAAADRCHIILFSPLINNLHTQYPINHRRRLFER
jgi:hypothetical protein